MGKIFLGINMEFVRHHDKPFAWGVEKAAEIGYQYIEPMVHWGRELLSEARYFHSVSMYDDPRWARDLCDRHHIKMSGLSSHTPLCKPENSVEYLKLAIRWASDAGAPVVNTDEGPKPDWTSKELVLHNARTCALFRESPTQVEALDLDLLDAERAAEVLGGLRPTLIVNSACLLSLYPFFPALRKRQRRMGLVAGFAHTLPKDLAVLWPLMRAVREASPDTAVVNLAAPDTAHAMLSGLGLSPTVGAGTIDSTAQGIRMAAARMLGVHPRRVEVRLVCHHAIRRLPVGTIPYALRVMLEGLDVTPRLSAEALIAEAVDVTGVETMSTPVTSNAAITAASAVETARAPSRCCY